MYHCLMQADNIITSYINKYIDFLIHKLIIYNDQMTRIDNIHQINYNVDGITKKNIDIKLYELTDNILKQYKYEVIWSKTHQNDANFCKVLCDQYKNFQQNTTNKKDNTKIVYSKEINTEETYYVDTFNKSQVNTELLIKTYGNLFKTGDNLSKHRYEYKFKYMMNKIEYIFSLYDWYGEKEDDIEWHIAGNTDNKKVIQNFKISFITGLKCDCCLIE